MASPMLRAAHSSKNNDNDMSSPLTQRTQVAIIGAGPAGLLLGALLHRAGIDSAILERRDRTYVEGRIRAGVLEEGSVALLHAAGVAERLRREGLVHDGIEIALDGARTKLDFRDLTGGRTVTVYGQTQVVRDLIAARLASGAPLLFECEDVALHDLGSDRPYVTYRKDGTVHQLDCDIVAGCDGFHGICRQSIPQDALRIFEKVYPYSWLGILAEAPPPADDLIYARHRRGFALFSMRSASISRHYIQCAADEALDRWSDEAIWDELALRLGAETPAALPRGRVLERGITPMRSFVAEPMRHHRLFLAGDAAHIVPPTGAKGLNLAFGDIHYLFEGLRQFYHQGSEAGLDAYSDRALARVWKAQRFSWWMTSMLHEVSHEDPFEARIRRSELAYVLTSRPAQVTLAENYVGLPF